MLVFQNVFSQPLKANDLTIIWSMGHVEVDMEIKSPDGGRSVKASALVDTGATFTVITQTIAKQLGLKSTGERVKVTTERGADELDLTHALLEVDGKRRIMPVLVSRSLDRVLLGVITLEAMQLRVNPASGKLEEHSALLY